MMRAALALARRSLGQTWPNPAVGCVIVRDGAVLARGRTREGGRPHAEADAIAQADQSLKGATVYVTLEPCSHHGRTPPCADALVAAGVARVVSALEDPDPRVKGQGHARLKAMDESRTVADVHAVMRNDEQARPAELVIWTHQIEFFVPREIA